jgi:hypothetical protein
MCKQATIQRDGRILTAGVDVRNGKRGLDVRRSDLQGEYGNRNMREAVQEKAAGCYPFSILRFVLSDGTLSHSSGVEMKLCVLFCSFFLISCGNKEARETAQTSSQGDPRIEQTISALYTDLDKAYNGSGMNTDSLIDAYYDRDVRYVTAWGWTEPLDTTKSRLRKAAQHIKEYSHRIESMQVKSYGSAAYAFFILRQSYQVDGRPLEEYLPTTLVFEKRGSDWKIVHAHRSTDYETIQQYVALQQKRDAKK